MTAFMEKSAALDGAQLPKSFDQVRGIYAQFVDLRKEVDRNLGLALENRENGTDKAVMSLGADFLAALETGSTDLEGQIRSLDQGLTGLLQIRAYAWATGTLGGGGSTILLNAIVTQPRPLTTQDAEKLAGLDASAAFAWKATGDLVAHASTSTTLKEIYSAPDNAYFEGEFAAQRYKLIDDLKNGRPPAFNLDSWRTTVTPALGKLASSTMNEIDANAEEARRASFAKAAVYLAGFIIVITASVASMTIIVGRVTKPIGRLTRSMIALSQGDTNINVAGRVRRDEIGEMARAVEIFREAAIRNSLLEAEATANREQAQRDRIEIQQMAEAEAEMRLNQATGALAGACTGWPLAIWFARYLHHSQRNSKLCDTTLTAL
ncbi:HAMP domain-containing protein [Rhizobium mongolense]